MGKIHLRTIFWIFLVIVTSTIIAEFTAGEAAFALSDSAEYLKVPATVEKIESDMVFFTTDTGATRTVSAKKIKKEKIKSLKPGDLVILDVDQGDLIVDINKRKK